MLLKNNKTITHIPHNASYDKIQKKLGTVDLEAIKAMISQKIDQLLNEKVKPYFTPAFIGAKLDWDTTPLCYLKKISGGDVKISGMFFGLICWVVIMERDDSWAFIDTEIKGKEVGITYFPVNS